MKVWLHLSRTSLQFVILSIILWLPTSQTLFWPQYSRCIRDAKLPYMYPILHEIHKRVSNTTFLSQRKHNPLHSSISQTKPNSDPFNNFVLHSKNSKIQKLRFTFTPSFFTKNLQQSIHNLQQGAQFSKCYLGRCRNMQPNFH